MKKARKRKMFIVLGMLLVIIGALVMWFTSFLLMALNTLRNFKLSGIILMGILFILMV